MKWLEVDEKTARHCLIIKEYDERTKHSRVYPLFFNTEIELARMARDLLRREHFQYDMAKAIVTSTTKPYTISTIEQKEREITR